MIALALIVGCKSVPEWERGKKVVHFALRANVASLDPVRASTQYADTAGSQVYETLVSYAYLARPYRLEPLLAVAMPQVSDDGLTYTFTLKQGVRFHDNECFADGVGREMVAQDVVWSLMRMADRDLTPGGWWIFQDRIVGFDEFQARMNDRPVGAPFDWDAPIAGLRALDRYRVRVQLERPFPQFLYILAMTYSAVIPRECADYYGPEFGATAVGTGPWVLREFVRDVRLVYDRNEAYHEMYYPSEAHPSLAEAGFLEPAGRQLPLADALVFDIYFKDDPMWLKFRVGDIDLVQVPAEYYDGVFDSNRELRPKFVAEGVRNDNLALLDYIYMGFNMEDPIVGHGQSARDLRCAISLAVDAAEINDTFYNNTAILYDGPIPPGLDGYKPGVTSPFRGPQLDAARALLAKAGYPGGNGLPPLHLYTNKSSNSMQQAELLQRQVGRIGVTLEAHFDSFAELQTKLKRKKAQLFNLSWGADYPDAENFLQLFYGPNGAPGSNNFNYANPAYDALYDQTRVMFPSPERTEIYRQMRQIIIDDCPATRNMARTRFYVWNPRLHYVAPQETFYNWFKYVDADPR